MTLHTWIDMGLMLMLLLDLTLLISSRLATCIRIFAFQCAVLAFVPLGAELLHGETVTLDPLILLVGTIGLKAIVIPWVLMRTIRTGEIHRDVEPLIGYTASVGIGSLIIAGSFAVGAHLRIPGNITPISDLLVPVAISTIFIGLLIMVSRSKAITQVLGYLVLENGIFLFGLMLLRPMPRLVELGILLDVFVGVFVMAIVVYQIRRTFDHMDTHVLGQPKES